MNRRELDAIREREAAAAGGPWTYEGRVLWGRDEYGRIKADTPADREFTEHARDDVPALLAEVERLRSLVGDLYDANRCWFDHHGYCQEHGWFETDPPCPDGRAQELFEDSS